MIPTMPARGKPRATPPFTFAFSMVRGARDAHPVRVVETWDDFTDRLRTFPRPRADKDGPAWLPAVFGEDRNDQGNLRHDANVVSLSAVVLDLDGKGGHYYTAAELRERLAGLEYVSHTTYSSTADWPRWRVVVPLAAP